MIHNFRLSANYKVSRVRYLFFSNNRKYLQYLWLQFNKAAFFLRTSSIFRSQSNKESSSKLTLYRLKVSKGHPCSTINFHLLCAIVHLCTYVHTGGHTVRDGQASRHTCGVVHVCYPRWAAGMAGRLVDNDDDNVNKYNSITFDNDTDEGRSAAGVQPPDWTVE